MQRRAHPGPREGAFVAPPALTTVRARTLFTPLDTGGRADTVTRRLAQAIRLGLLLDGERLPAESQLAGQLGVSTVTLREALATLRTMGLVETRRGRGGGSFVRAPDEPTGWSARSGSCPCTNCATSATTGRRSPAPPPGWPPSARCPPTSPRSASMPNGSAG